MATSVYNLAPMLPLCFATVYSLLLVRGEMCGVITRPAPGEDRTVLRNKTFSAFREECRFNQKPQTDENNSYCSFFTDSPIDATSQVKFILTTLSMPFLLNFKVKTKHEALVVLSEQKEPPWYVLIAIGGFGNSKSVIEPCFGCHGYAPEHVEEGIVSQTEFRPFWIKYEEGIIRVGKGGQTESFMEWDVGKYHGRVATKLHIGILTYTNPSGGYWEFSQFCE